MTALVIYWNLVVLVYQVAQGHPVFQGLLEYRVMEHPEHPV